MCLFVLTMNDYIIILYNHKCLNNINNEKEKTFYKSTEQK